VSPASPLDSVRSVRIELFEGEKGNDIRVESTGDSGTFVGDMWNDRTDGGVPASSDTLEGDVAILAAMLALAALARVKLRTTSSSISTAGCSCSCCSIVYAVSRTGAAYGSVSKSSTPLSASPVKVNVRRGHTHTHHELKYALG
jgi:hypothetical protein